MPPGDLAHQHYPHVSSIEVAARELYETVFVVPPLPWDALGPTMGPALLNLLDACHTHFDP